MLQTRSEGEWTIITAETPKSFEKVRTDASRGLMQGFSGVFARHRWDGHICKIEGMGVESTVTYIEGRPLSTIECRVRFMHFPSTLFRRKIISDVVALTHEVSGAVSAENRRVFIVHGHDLEARSQLENLLESLGLTPIILEHQDDLGKTIIAKFEHYASNCGFAFILMTPDDSVASANDKIDEWRARQNVIMEMGWFMARLGRERVVLLHKKGVEIPSDILGVIYMRFDQHVDELELRIAKRLMGAGVLLSED